MLQQEHSEWQLHLQGNVADSAGDFTIADVMYAPVALRFVTYSIPVSDRARQFVDAVQRLESVQQWIEAARAEGIAGFAAP